MPSLRNVTLALTPVVVAGTGFALHKRHQKQAGDAPPAPTGTHVSSWGEIRQLLADHESGLAHAKPETYLGALEAICGHEIDFGFVERTADRLEAIVVRNDRIFSLEVLSGGRVGGSSGYVGQITDLKVSRSRDRVGLDIGYEPGQDWHLEAGAGQESLSQFGAELGHARERASSPGMPE